MRKKTKFRPCLFSLEKRSLCDGDTSDFVDLSTPQAGQQLPTMQSAPYGPTNSGDSLVSPVSPPNPDLYDSLNPRITSGPSTNMFNPLGPQNDIMAPLSSPDIQSVPPLNYDVVVDPLVDPQMLNFWFYPKADLPDADPMIWHEDLNFGIDNSPPPVECPV